MKRVLVFLLCLAALALVLYPIVWLISASLTPVEDLVANLRSLFPRRVTTHRYRCALAGAGGEKGDEPAIAVAGHPLGRPVRR